MPTPETPKGSNTGILTYDSGLRYTLNESDYLL